MWCVFVCMDCFRLYPARKDDRNFPTTSSKPPARKPLKIITGRDECRRDKMFSKEANCRVPGSIVDVKRY